MRNKLVAANWKMNGDFSALAAWVAVMKESVPEEGGAQVVFIPPYPYLRAAVDALCRTQIGVGAQDVSAHVSGAFTGEVSAGMLLECGCKYVLVGHSERRSMWSESDEIVAAKFEAATKVGLIPILCVGECLEERELGLTEKVVVGQLNGVLDRVGPTIFGAGVVAYEPVWAIGTGLTATPQQAQEVHGVIRSRLAACDDGLSEKTQILYGGSVKAGNATELFSMPDIDGGLVGGASLDAGEFAKIANAALSRS